MCQSMESTSFWHAQLYTVDPSNSQGLGDYLPGRMVGGDSDPLLGGHLINPASQTTRFVDSAGNEVAPAITHTGTELTSYMAADNPTSDPTLYYRLASFSPETSTTAPSVDGYVTLTTSTSSQANGSYTNTYVYLTQAEVDAGVTPTDSTNPVDPTDGTLASTGFNQTLLLSGAVGLMLATAIFIRFKKSGV